jgi:hypothetical protein
VPLPYFLSLDGHSGTGIGITVKFSQFQVGEEIFESVTGTWILSWFIVTLLYVRPHEARTQGGFVNADPQVNILLNLLNSVSHMEHGQKNAFGNGKG